MNRLTAARVCLALLLAAYNVVMFGIDLAYDSGATYQWVTYPLACFAWAFCVAIMMLEIKYGMRFTQYIIVTLWPGTACPSPGCFVHFSSPLSCLLASFSALTLQPAPHPPPTSSTSCSWLS
jgi:hypothetical protein